MTKLLVKTALVLAAAELAVMFALPYAGLTEHPLAYLLDPLLMLAVALGPLYLLLRGDLARLEKNKRLDAKLHAIVSDLWSASLHTVSAGALLDGILLEVLDSAPLSIQSRGAIFLVEDGELRLKSSRGFTEDHKRLCGSVPAGRCLCGKALESGETVFARGIDERHDILPPGAVPHGHYCLPIKSAGQVIGALAVYLEADAARDPDDERFLASVCAIIARILEGKKLERSLFQMQKMDALNRFAAGISHDFNNILGAVGGYASAALARLRPGDPCYEDMTEVSAAVDRGEQLTRQLKLFSRQAQDARETVDINLRMESASAMLRRLIGGGIKLETALAGAPLPVNCSPSQLDQVLLNLATNARDAMPGGGTLRLETAMEEICFVSTRQCLKAARISVSDTGEGMSEGVLERAFEPFFTTKGEGKGSGMGLAIIHGVVHQHGGEIVLRSAPGAGTRVDIYLPLAGESEGKQPEMPD